MTRGCAHVLLVQFGCTGPLTLILQFYIDLLLPLPIESKNKNTNSATLPLQSTLWLKVGLHLYRQMLWVPLWLQGCRGQLSLALHNVHSCALIQERERASWEYVGDGKKCWKAWMTEIQGYFLILSHWLSTFDSVLCCKRLYYGREKCVVCLSVELQPIECTLTDDVTSLCKGRSWTHSHFTIYYHHISH